MNKSNQNVNSEKKQVEYAGFWIRFLAFFIDTVVVMIPFVVILVLLFLAGVDPMVQLMVSLFSFYILFPIGRIIYFIVMTYKYQATFGKKWLGLSVATVSSSKNLSLMRVILRESIGKIASGLIVYVGYIIVAFTEKKQGLHDFIAETVVVSDPNRKPSSGDVAGIAIGALFVYILLVALILGVTISLVKGMDDDSEYVDSDYDGEWMYDYELEDDMEYEINE